MRSVLFRFSILLLTFIFGCFTVWTTGIFHLSEATLPINSEFFIASYTVIPITSEQITPRFTPTLRACGNGYAQGYETSDGQQLTEGNVIFATHAEAKKELKKMLTEAERIIERIPNYKDRFGDMGKRIVLVYPPDADGKKKASILWFDGGKRLQYIDAPSLELALEFERSGAYAY